MGARRTPTLSSVMGTWVVSRSFAITNNTGVNPLVACIFAETYISVDRTFPPELLGAWISSLWFCCCSKAGAKWLMSPSKETQTGQVRSLGGTHEWCWCSRASSLAPLKFSIPVSPDYSSLRVPREAAPLKPRVWPRQACRRAARITGPATPMVRGRLRRATEESDSAMGPVRGPGGPTSGCAPRPSAGVACCPAARAGRGPSERKGTRPRGTAWWSSGAGAEGLGVALASPKEGSRLAPHPDADTTETAKGTLRGSQPLRKGLGDRGASPLRSAAFVYTAHAFAAGKKLVRMRAPLEYLVMGNRFSRYPCGRRRGLVG